MFALLFRNDCTRSGSRGAFTIYVLVTILTISPSLEAAAISLDMGNAEVKGTIDTTLSAGLSVRATGRDADLIGRSNGGTANSINYDNGNLNYDNGDIFSAPFKLTQEIELEYKNIGFFGRWSAFYDIAIEDQDLDRRDRLTGRDVELSDSAQRLSGRNIRPLDIYLSTDFDLGDYSVAVKLGNQVVSWGESTFIQNGINTINPVELGVLRGAGAELREGLKPVPMVDTSISLNDNLSVELFYQFVFRHTEIEPEGTFLSVNDFASPGGNIVFLGFGTPMVPDSSLVFGRGANSPFGVAVQRGDDRDAKDQGQFGVAFRYFEPNLNDTEFGFYWTRLHSRLPMLSVQTGSPQGVGAGDFASSSSYFREFPENLDTVGVSFNTTIPGSGTALQGELSYAIDRPLQVDEVELLFAAFTPLAQLNPDLRVFMANGLGGFGFNERIQGYREKDVLQYQQTATHLFGPMAGADQLVGLLEVGLTYVDGLENKDELLYNAPGTYTHGNPLFTRAGVQPATQSKGDFADDFSWGYRLLTRAEYNNVIGSVSLAPQIAFSHDVTGTTPGPGGNFVEDRKVVTLTLGANYLSKVRTAISYSNFFDGGVANQRKDRDFVSVTASYAF